MLDFDIQLPGGPERAVSLQDIRGHTPFVVAAGHEPRNASEVAIGAATLEDHDLAIGDEVTVSREGHEATMEIVGVSVLPVNDDGGLGSSGVALHRDALDALGFDGVCEDNEPCSRGFAVTRRRRRRRPRGRRRRYLDRGPRLRRAVRVVGGRSG